MRWIALSSLALAVIILYRLLLWPDKRTSRLVSEKNEVVFRELHTLDSVVTGIDSRDSSVSALQGEAGVLAKPSRQNSS